MKQNSSIKMVQMGLSVLSLLYISFFLISTTSSGSNSDSLDHYEQDVHYEYLSKPIAAEKGNVMVLFWYGSPNSYTLVNELMKSEAVKAGQLKISYVPATLNDKWVDGARSFYTLTKMNKINELHMALFEAYRKKPEFGRSDLELFVKESGLDPDKFWEVFFSPEATRSIKAYVETAQVAGLEYIPTMVVSGKYKILTNYAKNWTDVFRVMEYVKKTQPQKQIRIK